MCVFNNGLIIDSVKHAEETLLSFRITAALILCRSKAVVLATFKQTDCAFFFLPFSSIDRKGMCHLCPWGRLA